MIATLFTFSLSVSLSHIIWIGKIVWSCELCFQRWHNERCMMFRASAGPRRMSTNCCFTWELISSLLIRLEYIMHWIYRCVRVFVCVWVPIVKGRVSVTIMQPAVETSRQNNSSQIFALFTAVSLRTTLHSSSSVWPCMPCADVLHCTSNGRQIIVICSVFSLLLQLLPLLLLPVCCQYNCERWFWLCAFLLSFRFVSFWLTFTFVTTLVDCWCWVCSNSLDSFDYDPMYAILNQNRHRRKNAANFNVYSLSPTPSSTHTHKSNVLMTPKCY